MTRSELFVTDGKYQMFYDCTIITRIRLKYSQKKLPFLRCKRDIIFTCAMMAYFDSNEMALNGNWRLLTKFHADERDG